MQTSQMASQSESIQEVSSKSDNEKVFKNRGKLLGDRGGIRARGISEKKCEHHKFTSKSNKWKVFETKNSCDGFWKMGGIRRRGGFRKNMQMSQIPSQNESMQEVSPKSDESKIFKNREDGVWEREGRGNSGERGISKTNAAACFVCFRCHLKMNLCRKSHPNRTTGKC